MQKPSVLPDPVWPRPRMSRPDRASGSVAAWMGKGVVMPSASSTATRGAGTPMAAKEAGAGRHSMGRDDKNDPPDIRWPRFEGHHIRGNQLARQQHYSISR